MAIKVYKPTTSGRRKMSVTDYSVLNKKKSEKRLTVAFNRAKGRDNTGQISVRHKGGGAKRKFRLISSLSDKMGVKAKIEALEYDPNRTSFIVLVKFEDGVTAYLLAWDGVKVGDEVIAQEKAEIKVGNRMRISNIPTGISIYDIEVRPGQGGKMIKSAGAQAFILAKEGNYAQIKMPSGEIRKINVKSFASIGQVSNLTHSAQRIGKAGRKRHMGIRPTVRGKVMHPAAHPHGGGEGVNPIGLKYPKTPWGKNAYGVKTRKKKKYSANMIVRRRK
jgi:large subunit ribosomal protein L2